MSASSIASPSAAECTDFNHCSCDGKTPSQKYGIEEIGEADENTLTGNQCHGNIRGGLRVVGGDTQLAANGGKVER